MLVGAVVLFLAPVVFLAGTALGRAFGRSQAFEEAAALLRFDAAQATSRGQRAEALLLRLEAQRLCSVLDGVPAEEDLEQPPEPTLVRVADARASASC
jgi:hypothetical protein